MDLFFKVFLAIILIFITFAFAGTLPWAFAVFQGGVFLLALMLVFRRGLPLSQPFKAAAAGFAFIIIYMAIQACFPTTFLEKPTPYPSTLMRLYTLEHISLFATWLCLFTIGAEISKNFNSNKSVLWILLIPILATAALNTAATGLYYKFFYGVTAGVGSFLNRNHGGCALSIGTIFIEILTLTHIAAKKEYINLGRKNTFYIKLFVLISVLIFMIISTIFTRSRGAMLSLGAGTAFYALSAAFLFFKKIKTKVLVFSIISVLTAISITTAYKNLEAINVFAKRSAHLSVDIRKDLYSSAFKALKQRPLYGYGAGAMPIMITNYTKPLSNYIEHLHSDPLEIFLGIGIIGAAPLLICILFFCFFILKRLKKLSAEKRIFVCGLVCACIAFFISSTVDFPFFIPACSALFFITAGMLCGVSFWKGGYSVFQPPIYFKAFFIVFFVFCFWLSAQKAAAWRYYKFADGFKFEGKISYYQKALELYPSPRFALRLGVEYYNKSLDKNITPEEKENLREKAKNLAETYLKKYPREKELSKLYINVR